MEALAGTDPLQVRGSNSSIDRASSFPRPSWTSEESLNGISAPADQRNFSVQCTTRFQVLLDLVNIWMNGDKGKERSNRSEARKGRGKM